MDSCSLDPVVAHSVAVWLVGTEFALLLWLVVTVSVKYCSLRLQYIHNLNVMFCFFLQSRTPALVFEHVNNTDFKVGTEPLLCLWNPPFLACLLFSCTRACM